MTIDQEIRLTQFSHGAGCGCKISPMVLDQILSGSLAMPDNDRLIVGNHSRDDAAVYDMDNGTALVATTDFFMPVVDDPFDFGRIAAANAISDIYAMGATPLLAIAILGWPVNKLPASIAAKVIEGGRSICREAGIPLAGGHSIDSPEPIFGLAVNGIVNKVHIKQNNTARKGDLLFLTKPLGVGILTTAEKKGLLKPAHEGLATAQMMKLNRVGGIFGSLTQVSAMTDVTGFGLLGHLTEMAEGSGLTAVIPDITTIRFITDDLHEYLRLQCIPGGTNRNWESYGHKINLKGSNDERIAVVKGLLADPQTSGGLLVAVDPQGINEFQSILCENQLKEFVEPIGFFAETEGSAVRVVI